MSNMQKREQSSGASFLTYARSLLSVDTPYWDEIHERVESDPTGSNLAGYKAHLVGAMAVQWIRLFRQEQCTDGPALTAHGTISDSTDPAASDVHFNTYAMVAAKSRAADYPHISLSRAQAPVVTESGLIARHPAKVYILPLIKIPEDQQPTHEVVRGAFVTLTEATWEKPAIDRMWPPFEPFVKAAVDVTPTGEYAPFMINAIPRVEYL